MTLTIDATVGGASANSFVTEAEQIAYMAARLNATAWTTVSGATCTETEKTAMIEATRDLTKLPWQGLQAADAQALAWPRWNVVNPDSSVLALFDTDDIPQRVKNAQMELAFQYLNAGTTDLAVTDSQAGVIEETVGPITTRWANPTSRPQGLKKYERVMREIGPLLGSNTYTARLVRG